MKLSQYTTVLDLFAGAGICISESSLETAVEDWLHVCHWYSTTHCTVHRYLSAMLGTATFFVVIHFDQIPYLLYLLGAVP